MATCKPETGIREAIFRDVPAYFDRSPDAAPGFTISYDGTGALVSIAQRQLSITVSGGTGDALLLDLREHTLETLVTAINAHPGYTASVVGATGAIPAIALVPLQREDLFFEPRLSYFRSTVWCLLMALVYALEDALEQIEIGARQLYLDTAEAAWVDNWGAYYARIERREGEADRSYARRIIRDVTRWKLNGRALEEILLDDLGVHARIINLHEQAWLVGGRLTGRLAGRKYSRTTFEVIVADLVAGIADVVNRARAAGTLPYYQFAVGMGLPDTTYGALSVQLRAVENGAARYGWIIGRDRCGELPLFGKHLSLSELFFRPLMDNYLHVQLSMGSPLVLGVGALGTGVLGNVDMFGILFSDGGMTVTVL